MPARSAAGGLRLDQLQGALERCERAFVQRARFVRLLLR
jgi:hypothetical protein